MKKLYSILMCGMMAMTASAQVANDTVYVMFDFNKNPWNFLVSQQSSKGWGPDYDDETGAIFKETDFSWPLTEGSDRNIVVTVYPVDLDEYERPAIYALCEEYGVGTKDADGKYPMYNMLFTNPGTSMRFKAPKGYKFGKMLFYDYRQSYYVLDTEEIVIEEREGTKHSDSHKIWIPTTPKKNSYGEECWQGDEADILFDNYNFKGNFMKIDMRLVPDGSDGISSIEADGQASCVTSLSGVRVSRNGDTKGLRKGVYIIGNRKYVVK